MKTTLKLNMFEINQCGYYQSNQDKVFGSINKTLDDLKAWLETNPTVGTTSTFSVDIDDENPLPSVYGLNVYKCPTTEDYLLTTWNTSFVANEKFASISPSTSLNEPEIKLQEYPEGNIPGYPSYFWFIPSKDVFITLRFGSQVANGHSGLKKYLTSFLQKFSSHCHSKETAIPSDEFKIIGYSESGPQREGSIPRPLRPIFSSSPYRKLGSLEYIKENRRNITKLIYKSSLEQNYRVDVNLYQKLLRKIKCSSEDEWGINRRDFRYEIEYQPSETNLNSIINDWLEDSDKSENVGFKLKGESDKIRWLKNALINEKHEINISLSPTNLYDPEDLLKAIQQFRANMLKRIEVHAADSPTQSAAE